MSRRSAYVVYEGAFIIIIITIQTFVIERLSQYCMFSVNGPVKLRTWIRSRYWVMN